MLKALGVVLMAPIRVRRNPHRPPASPAHYVVRNLAGTAEAVTVRANDVPHVSTPTGRWTDWPALVLAKCDEPLARGAPDLRGVWQVHKGPLKAHIERVEQAGARVVITSSGIIHDLVVDGSMMHDEGVGGAGISVEARFEEGRFNLYLRGKWKVVTRYRDGDEMVWRWGPWTSRLRQLDDPGDAALRTATQLKGR